MKNLISFVLAVFFLAAAGTCLSVQEKTTADSTSLTDPYQILMAYYDAIGGLKTLKNKHNTYAHGSISFSGMTGKFHLWQQGMQYRREAHYPAFSMIAGDDGKQMWELDLNKKRLILTDEKSKKRRRLRELLDQFENINRQSPFFTLKYIGTERVNNEACYVIETKNSINDDIYYYYISTKSYYLLKQITQQPFLKIVTDYSDFKIRANIIYPFYSEVNITPTGKKIIIRINELSTDISIATEKFIIPADDIKDYQFEHQHSAESIPFLLAENNIYLPVIINGEERYWVLDSGADMSVIDADYAKKMGLKLYGKLSGNATGNLAEFNFVKLKEYQLKGVKLHEQTILSYQGLADNFFEPDAVGILGYDFLSRFITKIDYANQRVSFFEPEYFNYKGPGRRIDSPLQDKIFMFPMLLDDSIKGHFALDLGSYNVSLNYPFAKKHNLMNKPGVVRLSSDIVGVFSEQQNRADSMKIAGYSVKNELLSFPIEKSNGTNSDSESDGLIGNSLLRHFVLFLDYKHQQLIFEKGDDYNKQFAVDKSGMTIGLSINNRPEIFYVAKDTPADHAGIQIGDIIIAIDDLSGRSLPGVTQIISMFRAGAGTTYRLSLQRKERELSVELQLKGLYP